jgi:hypothetical protein
VKYCQLDFITSEFIRELNSEEHMPSSFRFPLVYSAVAVGGDQYFGD